MKKEEALNQAFLDMNSELNVSHNNLIRKINRVFSNEIQHFQELLVSFNNEYSCLENYQVNLQVDIVKHIFNSCKVVVTQDYQSRFDKYKDGLVSRMHDFFIAKVNNKNVKSPVKDISRYLLELCRCDFFAIQDQIENSLDDYFNDFSYHFINSSNANEEFSRIIKSLKHSLTSELKKVISNSNDDKENIVTRYNSMGKEILNRKEMVR